MNSDFIPYDLMIEIFSRLPTKSIARFHCVSKQWGSMFHHPDFTKFFLTRSSGRPRLLFAVKGCNGWSFYSSPQRQNPYEKSSSTSLEVAAEFHTKFPPENMAVYGNSNRRPFSCSYDSGLIYFNGMWISGKDENCGVPVICNPNTGRYATLPKLRLSRSRIPNSLFGFDPIDKQFKVSFRTHPYSDKDYRILTLGTMRWRKTHCPINHEPLSESICINGVLYYLAEHISQWRQYIIVCFNVRSEKFEIIYYPKGSCHLVNYMGKLGVIYHDDYDDDAIVLYVCVLEDFEKKEWSEYAYILRDEKFLHNSVSVVGVTATGEIVLSMTQYTSKQPFYVFYFHPESKTLQSVEIKGFGAGNEEYGENFSVHTFVNHVDDLNVNDGKLLKSSIYGQYVKLEEKYHCEDKDGEYDNNYVDEERERYDDNDSGDDYGFRSPCDYGYDYVYVYEYEYGNGDESEEGEMENERERKKKTKKMKVKKKKKVKHPNQKEKQNKRLHTDAKEEAATRTM